MPWRWFVLYAVVALVARGALLGVPIVDKDEAIYMVVARELLRGALLYVDVVDHHPPLAYVYYAAVERLLGLDMLGVRLVTTLLVVPLTAQALAAFFDHDRRGRLAALAYVVWGGAFLGHDMLAVNCEVLLLLPAPWALVAAARPGRAAGPRRLFLAGALLGVAVLVKYQAALWLPALALVALQPSPGARVWRARLVGLAALGCGALLPVLACAGWFATRGATGELIYWNWTHNLSYTANPVPAREVLERLAAFALPFALSTAPLWWGAWRSRAAHEPARLRLLAAALAGSLAAAALGLRLYPHYFILVYPPLALLAAPWLEERLRCPLGRAGRAVATALLGTWAAFTASTLVLYYGPFHVYPERWQGYEEVARWLRQDRCEPDPALFVWGHTAGFHHASGLRPGSRFVFIEDTLAGYLPGNQAAIAGAQDTSRLVLRRHWDLLMEDLERRRPAYVLDVSRLPGENFEHFPVTRFARLSAFLAGSYRVVAMVRGVAVYRRRDCDRGPAAPGPG